MAIASHTTHSCPPMLINFLFHMSLLQSAKYMATPPGFSSPIDCCQHDNACHMTGCKQSDMDEEEERQYIHEATETLKQHTGKAPEGWLGPWISESHVTLDLLQVFQVYHLFRCCAYMSCPWAQLPMPAVLPAMPTCHSKCGCCID